MEIKIMDKYKETIEKLKNLLNDSKSKGHIIVPIEDVENAIPELKESEDEKIRKELIRAFKSLNTIKVWNGIERTDILAWLEKQGHQEEPQVYKTEDGEVITYSEDDGYKVVEPKFKVGDWITDGYLHCKISDVLDDRYIVNTKFGKRSAIQFKCEDNYHLWTIQDAKDGDVLAEDVIESYSSSFVAIFKKQNGEDFDSYCFVGFNGKFYEGENGHSTEEIHPATKEQRDTLERAMANAGYEWDVNKLELRKNIG